MGENPTTCGSLSCRNPDSTSFWERYPATTSGTVQWSWSVTSRRLPKISVSRVLRAAGSIRQVRRNDAGVVPVSSVVSTRVTQQGWAVAAGFAAGQGRSELAQGPDGLGEGLGEAGGLGCVQGFGVGQDHPPVGAEHDGAGVTSTQPGELLDIDRAAPAGG